MHKLFDTHFHCYSDVSASDYYAQAEAEGVSYLLAAGSNYEESVVSRDFAEEVENSWFASGVHPHEASDFEEDISMFDEFSEDEKMVAVGEIGLDYFYENSVRSAQRKVFEAFLQRAIKINKPVIVHCRDRDNMDDAYHDAYGLLKDFYRDGGRFVTHCFTGTEAWAEKFLEIGAYIGITGIVTFPKAQNVRDVLKCIPDDRLLLETDTPYLAPVPYRGKRNHSAYLKEIAQYVAERKQLTIDKIADITTNNAMDFFHLSGQ